MSQFMHRYRSSLRPRLAAVGALLLSTATLAQAGTAIASPQLSFSSSASVYGYIYTSYSSPLLGDVSFNLQLPREDRWSNGAQNPTGVAEVNYSIPTTGGPSGDPVYDIVTSNGQYGFSYSGKAQVDGLKLRTQVSSQTVDVNGDLTASPNSYLSAGSYAQWNNQFYIAPTAVRAAGSYGAIVVGLKVDGSFPALSDPNRSNDGQLRAYAQSSFTDTAGVSYNSQFDVNHYPWQGQSWPGSKTVYKKLLFQYGTPFSLNLYQQNWMGANGSADFFHTGEISSIELPFGATLDSGAQQAGLGGVSLYGNVFNSATADAQNTNWDFGNNGGGFTPPVPEPSSYLLMLAGLGALGFLVRRRV